MVLLVLGLEEFLCVFSGHHIIFVLFESLEVGSNILAASHGSLVRLLGLVPFLLCALVVPSLHICHSSVHGVVQIGVILEAPDDVVSLVLGSDSVKVTSGELGGSVS